MPISHHIIRVIFYVFLRLLTFCFVFLCLLLFGSHKKNAGSHFFGAHEKNMGQILMYKLVKFCRWGCILRSVKWDLLNLYLASVLTSSSTWTSNLEANIWKIAIIFQARKPKFCKVVDLYLLYLYLASLLISASTSTSEVTISNIP